MEKEKKEKDTKGRKEKQEWSEELTKSTKCKRKEQRQGRATKAKSGVCEWRTKCGSMNDTFVLFFVDSHSILCFSPSCCLVY